MTRSPEEFDAAIRKLKIHVACCIAGEDSTGGQMQIALICALEWARGADTDNARAFAKLVREKPENPKPSTN